MLFVFRRCVRESGSLRYQFWFWGWLWAIRHCKSPRAQRVLICDATERAGLCLCLGGDGVWCWGYTGRRPSPLTPLPGGEGDKIMPGRVL